MLVGHHAEDLNHEIMRLRVWTDPDVEAWMAEHAVGVWMSREEAFELRLRSPTSFAVITNHHGRVISLSLNFRLPPKALVDWLRNPGDRELQIGRHDDFEALEKVFYDITRGDARVVPADAELCVRVWRSLPVASSRYLPNPSGMGRYETPVFGATRLIAAEHPRILDDMVELREELEARLAGEPNAVDRWHWMLLNAEVLDDRERVMRWIEAVHADPERIALARPLSRLIEHYLDTEEQWAMLFDFMNVRGLAVCDRDGARSMRWLGSSLDAAAVGAERPMRDPADVERIRQEMFRFSLYEERRLHLGALAKGETQAAAEQLVQFRLLGAHKAEATGYIISSARAYGLGHPLHLPFINYDRADHRALAASIRRQWPDADAIADALYNKDDPDRADPKPQPEEPR